MGGSRGLHKGFDFLESPLRHLQREIEDLQLVFFCQRAPKERADIECKCQTGSSDAVCIPCRGEAVFEGVSNGPVRTFVPRGGDCAEMFSV